MTRLTGGVFGLLISLILFIGISMVNFLSGNDALPYVGKDVVDFFKAWRMQSYGAICVLFILQQIWLRWPKPASQAEVNEIRGLVEQLLENALNDYYTMLATMLAGSGSAPSIRANIMLPTWRRFRCGRYLRMYYSHGGPAGLIYPNPEFDLKWRRGQGTCGYAWTKGRTVVYDSKNEGYKEAETRLSNKQKQNISYIQSVLSIPIWSRKKDDTIGVLNLDSSFNVDKTLFDNQNVVKQLEARARQFSNILFLDGVKSH